MLSAAWRAFILLAMARHPTQTLRGPRFTAAQRDALDAIGAALKQKTIDFRTATKLGELVKAGRSQEAAERLEAERKP